MDNVLIQTIIHTLNEIEVKGSGNLSKLLGCINALESMVAQEVQNDGNTD